MAYSQDPATTILLVDDEEMVTTLLAVFLRRAGYRVVIASDGREGMEAFQQAAGSVHLVVSDVDMPFVSGVELAKEAERQGCPVLLISGKLLPPEAEQAGWPFLAKPFRPNVLVETVGEILARRKRPGTARPRVLLAEDDAELRERLCRILGPDYEIVAALAGGETVVEMAVELHPDVILLDIGMPGMNGFAVAQGLQRSMPEVPLLFVTQHSDPAYVEAAFTNGVSGYLLKSDAVRELNLAVQQVRTGGRYLSPRLRKAS